MSGSEVSLMLECRRLPKDSSASGLVPKILMVATIYRFRRVNPDVEGQDVDIADVATSSLVAVPRLGAHSMVMCEFDTPGVGKPMSRPKNCANL
jgi:hypothetical protein